jgi:enoyl-[acyl-carrier protein] reductase II
VRALANAARDRFLDVQRTVIAKVDAGELDQKAVQLEIEHCWVGALRRAIIDGDVDNGSVMVGQSVGMVRSEQPLAKVIAELVAQAARALARRNPAT